MQNRRPYRAFILSMFVAGLFIAPFPERTNAQLNELNNGRALSQTRPTVTSSSSQHIQLYPCAVHPKQVIELPARVAGPLLQINVEAGSSVTTGDLLAQIDDQEAQLQKLAAETKLQASLGEAQNEISILEAQAALKVAQSDLARKEELLTKRATNEADVEHSRLAAEHAALALQEAEFNREIAILKANNDEKAVLAADALIERHVIKSPIPGQIYKPLKEIGEWVDAGESVFELYRLDTLRVDALVSGADYNPEDLLGRRVTVRVQRARGEIESLSGKVVHVDLRNFDQKLQVRTEIENRFANGAWILLPGSFVELTIHFNE